MTQVKASTNFTGHALKLIRVSFKVFRDFHLYLSKNFQNLESRILYFKKSSDSQTIEGAQSLFTFLVNKIRVTLCILYHVFVFMPSSVKLHEG